MKEIIAHRRAEETPRQTAARLCEKHGISLSGRAQRPLPRKAYDEMWDER